MKWHIENARRAVGALQSGLDVVPRPKKPRVAERFASLLTALSAFAAAIDALLDVLHSDGDDDDDEPETPVGTPPRP